MAKRIHSPAMTTHARKHVLLAAAACLLPLLLQLPMSLGIGYAGRAGSGRRIEAKTTASAVAFAAGRNRLARGIGGSTGDWPRQCLCRVSCDVGVEAGRNRKSARWSQPGRVCPVWPVRHLPAGSRSGQPAAGTGSGAASAAGTAAFGNG